MTAKFQSLYIQILQSRDTVLARLRPILQEHDLTEQQWRIIRLLAENGTMDFQVLARKACILRPSLTGILTRMEEHGLVKRQKHETDLRRVLLHLNPTGKRLYNKMFPKVDEVYGEIFKQMGEERFNNMITGLEDLVALNGSKNEAEKSQK